MTTCPQPTPSFSTPFPTSMSTSAISTTASSILSGTAWRRNLARLSKKWKPTTRQSYPPSGTVAAAATEKLIRRPKTTIQTEDLTASQFAHMAGIKIKRGRNHQDTDQSDDTGNQFMYDDDSDDDCTEDKDHKGKDDYDNAKGTLPLTLNHQQMRQLTTKATKSYHGSIPCMTSYSTTRCHPIWDARFWQQHQLHQNGEKNSDRDKMMAPTSPVGSMLSSSSGQYLDFLPNDSLSATDTCLSNSLSSTSLSSASSTSSSTSTKPRVFHKGRFQIVLGDDEAAKHSDEPLVRTISSESSNNVVEWHRKRTLTH